MHTFRPHQLRKKAAPVFYDSDEPYYEAAEPAPYYGADLPQPSGLLAAGGVVLLIGVLALPTFVVTPWIIKQFKPEWPYGKRLATTFVIGFGLTAITTIVRAAAGTSTTTTTPK